MKTTTVYLCALFAVAVYATPQVQTDTAGTVDGTMYQSYRDIIQQCERLRVIERRTPRQQAEYIECSRYIAVWIDG